MKRVLIIGSGGREHALAWALARSADHVYVAPGNAGTQWPAGDGVAPCENIALTDFKALIDFAREQQIDLTVVGPEVAIAQGIADQFTAAGLRIFAPTQAAGELESSKAFSKDFMRRHTIPTAEYGTFSDYESALAYVRALGKPFVIKADGLAAGKGVLLPDTTDEAASILWEIFHGALFGAAGEKVIIEERLTGREVSLLAFSDGETVVAMPPARDHKRIFDGDQGPNTGGMGAYAPVPDVSADDIARYTRDLLEPTVRGMAAEGRRYVGVLYAGLMLTPDGVRVLEFNCRFGDPETQALLPLLETPLYDVMSACVAGQLKSLDVRWKSGACAAVVLASAGYPGDYTKGIPITGLAEVPQDIRVFHAGTQRSGDQVVTAGGRVLAVTAVADTLALALQRAYAGVERIHFDGMQFRRDIGVMRDMTDQDNKDSAALTPVPEPESQYKQAGVNIDAGNDVVQKIKAALRSTFTPNVLSDVGNFGGLFDATALKGMQSPVLVASTDGVGTKTKVAAKLGRWDTVGADLVNHCINDILVQGARPLFFLDYVASAKIQSDIIAAVIQGMTEACREAGIALIGGETAEMPGVYETGEIDVAGTIIGAVERGKVITGKAIKVGDVLVGLPSSGLHTNGYSLARKVLDKEDWTAPRDDLKGATIGDTLLAVHRSYLAQVAALWEAGIETHGLAHITGGGVVENLPRIFLPGIGARINRGSWDIPPIFGLIQRKGTILSPEMYRVFNMGLGMILVIPAEQVDKVVEIIPTAKRIGEIVDGRGVQLA